MTELATELCEECNKYTLHEESISYAHEWAQDEVKLTYVDCGTSTLTGQLVNH